MFIINKKNINRILSRMGYEIRRKGKPPGLCNALEITMQGVISTKGTINVVQVGANDGSNNDPIYELLQNNQDRTRALLIEPQQDIIKYLKNAYASHPDVTIFNGAIGANDTLLLYRIKPAFWSSFHAPYLKHAPDYRAPSELTSANRAHVLNAAKKYLDKHIDPEDSVEEIQVPCMQLGTLLSKMKLPESLDLLQVDAEGEDDEVIYACNIEHLKPVVINYEFKHLKAIRKQKLESYLISNGYRSYDWSASDILAVSCK